MAIPESEKERLKNIEDASVKDHLKNEYISRQRELKTQKRQMDRENEAKAKKDRTKDWDGKPYFTQKTGDPKNPEIIGKINQDANTLANKAVSGYQDWSAAMQELLSYALHLHKALYYDPIEISTLIPYGEEAVAALGEVKNLLVDKTFGRVGEWIELRSLKSEDLPKLSFKAKVNEQGVIVTEFYKNNKPDKQLNYYFNQAVADWAKVQGFTEVSQPDGASVLQDEKGTKMTLEKFKELNADFETSIEKFLSNRMQMKIDYSGPTEEIAPGPRP